MASRGGRLRVANDYESRRIVIFFEREFIYLYPWPRHTQVREQWNYPPIFKSSFFSFFLSFFLLEVFHFRVSLSFPAFVCVCAVGAFWTNCKSLGGGKWWWWECTGPIPSPAASIISLYNYKYERVERKVVYVWRNSEWEKASPNSIPKRGEVFPSFGDPNHTYVEKRITSARALCSLTSWQMKN